MLNDPAFVAIGTLTFAGLAVLVVGWLWAAHESRRLDRLEARDAERATRLHEADAHGRPH